MNYIKKLSPLLVFAIVYFVAFPETAAAVPPPDFIFSVGSQVAQVFSVVVLFLSAIFGISYNFIKTKLTLMKSKKKIFIIISIILIIIISVGAAYAYEKYQQNLEYEKWLEETEKSQNSSNELKENYFEDRKANQENKNEYEDENQSDKSLNTKDSLNINSNRENLNQESSNSKSLDTENKKNDQKNNINKLIIGDTKQILRIPIDYDTSFISNIKNTNNDESIEFIENYYEAIATKDLEKAYEMSKKSVSLSTFKTWYKDTEKLTLDSLTKIDDTTSSLELTLYEADKFIRYGVLITLKKQNSEFTQIEKSSVRILSEGGFTEKGYEIILEKGDDLITDKGNEMISEKGDDLILENKDKVFTEKGDQIFTEKGDKLITETNDQERANQEVNQEDQNNSIFITNSELSQILNKQDKNYIILDARENLEYENGYMTDSLHIRFADLQAGKWIELPENKNIYVLCWSGIRGKEVTEFLRTKNLKAFYLENGANGWVESGGAWNGNIKFGEKYSEEKYKKLFTTSQTKKELENGTFLVDSREPWKFADSHIEGSVNIAIMYTPTSELKAAFAQVPANSRIITICDGYVNCFDAKITAVELEARGHEFIGRYNKPWEW